MIKYDEKNEYIFRIGYLVLHFEEGSVIKFGRNKENNVVFNDLSILIIAASSVPNPSILFLRR